MFLDGRALTRTEEMQPVLSRDVSALRRALIAIARHNDLDLRRNDREERKVTLLAPRVIEYDESYEYPAEMQLSASILTRGNRLQKLAMWFRQGSNHPDTLGQGVSSSYVFETHYGGWVRSSCRVNYVMPNSGALITYGHSGGEGVHPDATQVAEMARHWIDRDVGASALLATQRATEQVTRGDCALLSQTVCGVWGVEDLHEALSAK